MGKQERKMNKAQKRESEINRAFKDIDKRVRANILFDRETDFLDMKEMIVSAYQVGLMEKATNDMFEDKLKQRKYKSKG